jgi:hypothetical protein
LNVPVARSRSPKPPFERTGAGTLRTVICVRAVAALPVPRRLALVPAIFIEKLPCAGTTIHCTPVLL